jgi:hypothetical protein
MTLAERNKKVALWSGRVLAALVLAGLGVVGVQFAALPPEQRPLYAVPAAVFLILASVASAVLYYRAHARSRLRAALDAFANRELALHERHERPRGPRAARVRKDAPSPARPR